MSRTHVVEPDLEKVTPSAWNSRQKVTNWMLSSGRSAATCTDQNFGNIAVFSKKKFKARDETSFLLIINVNNPDFTKVRIGLVASNYSTEQNKDLRAHREYGFFELTPGNCALGSASEPYNLSISLRKQVNVNSNSVRNADEKVEEKPVGDVEMRVDISDSEARFRCPQLWGDDEVVQRISHQGDLNLAICAGGGFAFDLREIERRLTLERRGEVPNGLDLSLTPRDMIAVARGRCDEIVENIRRQSPEDGERYNILVAGAFGAGKSSLINTFRTLFSRFEQRPTHNIVASSKGSHNTSEVYSYQLLGTNVHLIDSIGLAMTVAGDSGEVILNHDGRLLNDLFRGNVNSGFKIESLEPVTTSRATAAVEDFKATEPVEGYNLEELSLDERNHGAFVVRAQTQYGDDGANVFNLILEFAAKEKNYPLVGVVTKLDVGVPDFTVRKLFTEPDIYQSFMLLRREMMLPSVFVARPYTIEDQHRQNAFYNLLAADLLDKMMREVVQYKERLRKSTA